MGILDAPSYSRSASDARYANLSKQRAASLVAKIGAIREAVPAVSTDAPTVTHGTTSTVTGQSVSAKAATITKQGDDGTWNTTFGRLTVAGIAGIDFYYNGTTVEITWFSGQSNTPIWIWIDGAPLTSAPDTSGAFASGTTYMTKLVWGAAKRRRIEMFVQGNNAWLSLQAAIADVISPAPAKPRIGFVYDSFGGGSAGASEFQSAPFMISRMLGADCRSKSIGGTGYVASATTFGGAARVSAIQGAAPDLVVISGSVNDDGQATVGTASAAAYAAYKAALPTVPIIVFGPQPSNSTDTISANRAANNNAVKTAATPAAGVIAFHDMVGTAGSATPPAAWVSGTTYAVGTLVTYQGSVWEQIDGGGTGVTTPPNVSKRWIPKTWLYTGTGKVGTTTGDGTRDLVLYSDGVHPTVDGSLVMAVRQASTILGDLAAYATS